MPPGREAVDLAAETRQQVRDAYARSGLRRLGPWGDEPHLSLIVVMVVPVTRVWVRA